MDSLPEERGPLAPSSLSRPAASLAPQCSLVEGPHSLEVEVAGSEEVEVAGWEEVKVARLEAFQVVESVDGWMPSSCPRPPAPNQTFPQRPRSIEKFLSQIEVMEIHPKKKIILMPLVILTNMFLGSSFS